MTISTVTPFLRFALKADAAVSGATGLLMSALAPRLADMLSLPAPLLFWSGLFLLPYAAALLFLATREELPHWTVWAVIAGNALWALDCVALVTVGRPQWVEPNGLGIAFVLVPAMAVAAFAEMQLVAIRRIATAAPRYA